MELDWEKTARARLEKQVADVVQRIRTTADSIERDAGYNLRVAADPERDHDWQTYACVTASVISEIQAMVFNLHLTTLIDAAAEAESARADKAVTS